MRVNELDSIRGLAALVVVFHHCWQSLLPDQNVFPFDPALVAPDNAFGWLAYWVSLSPLRLLFAGHAAVGIFFVLSGFVLTKSLETGRQGHYGQFIVRRFFRIWVPFAVVLWAAAALCFALAPQPIADHDWLNQSWNAPVTFKLVLGHLFMIGSPEYETLDNPMWSLVHELRISLIFPILLLMTKRYPKLLLCAFLAVFMLLSANRIYTLLFGWITDQSLAEVVHSFAHTARYTLFFVLGILLAIKTVEIKALLARVDKFGYVLWIISLALLALPFTKGYIDLLFAIGAFLLLALCLSSPRISTALRHGVPQWLGKISYSLYLVHLVVILTLVHLVPKGLPLYLGVLLAVPLSLLTAELVNRWVELPSNELGKRLALRL